VSWTASTPGVVRARPATRLLAVAAALLWLGAGGYGLTRYVVSYERYRGFPPPALAASIPSGRVVSAHLFAPALGRTASYSIYLPPGYAAAARAGRRFPVLYLLHPPPGSANGYVTIGALQSRMGALLAARRIRPFLVVIPDGHTAKDGNDTEWANAGAGRYEDFVLDVVRTVDRRWATIPERADRALAGLSEGGYGAANVTLHHLSTFGTFESWSGYFLQTPTQAFAGASTALLRANSPNDYVAGLRARLRRLPTYAFVYRGRQERLTTHPDTATFVARLRAAGGHVSSAEYPGMHNWKLWRAHMSAMLRFAARHFA
jgi:enterochelin esterase-like enzyme